MRSAPMYLLSYFRAELEELHLAVSRDALRWEAILQGKSIFRSPVGTRTVRDPFLCQAADGCFHLLSSDGWGSRSILHAVSDNLLHWHDARLVPVMEGVPSARNAWAPEAFWDRESSCWRLVWSSSTTESNTPTDFNHRIWSCTTEDFETFTPAAVLFDPGFSVIDACVVYAGYRYVMAFKDERGQNPPDHNLPGQRKAISLAFAPAALGPWTLGPELVSPPLTEGPSLFRCGSRWMMIFDHFIDGRFGAVTSVDAVNWSPASGPVDFPPGTRHASVLEITDALGASLLGAVSNPATFLRTQSSST